MWISRKHYNFLIENAEKNIDAECEILRVKDNQYRAVARAMEEYSTVLEERDKLKQQVIELENKLCVKDVHPCKYCDTGWGSISAEGCHGCEETCIRLKEYNEKYNT